MTSQFNEMLKINVDQIFIWQNVIHKFDNEISDESNYKTLISSSLFKDTTVVLAEILDLLKLSVRFKDNWSKPDFSPQISGAGVFIESERLDSKFYFGLFENNYVLSMSLSNIYMLNKMSYNFWMKFLEISKHCKLSILGDPGLPSCNGVDVEQQHKTDSNIFSLIRNFLILDIFELRLVDMAT